MLIYPSSILFVSSIIRLQRLLWHSVCGCIGWLDPFFSMEQNILVKNIICSRTQIDYIHAICWQLFADRVVSLEPMKIHRKKHRISWHLCNALHGLCCDQVLSINMYFVCIKATLNLKKPGLFPYKWKENTNSWCMCGWTVLSCTLWIPDRLLLLCTVDFTRHSKL